MIADQETNAVNLGVHVTTARREAARLEAIHLDNLKSEAEALEAARYATSRREQGARDLAKAWEKEAAATLAWNVARERTEELARPRGAMSRASRPRCIVRSKAREQLEAARFSAHDARLLAAGSMVARGTLIRVARAIQCRPAQLRRCLLGRPVSSKAARRILGRQEPV